MDERNLYKAILEAIDRYKNNEEESAGEIARLRDTVVSHHGQALAHICAFAHVLDSVKFAYQDKEGWESFYEAHKKANFKFKNLGNDHARNARLASYRALIKARCDPPEMYDHYIEREWKDWKDEKLKYLSKCAVLFGGFHAKFIMFARVVMFLRHLRGVRTYGQKKYIGEKVDLQLPDMKHMLALAEENRKEPLEVYGVLISGDQVPDWNVQITDWVKNEASGINFQNGSQRCNLKETHLKETIKRCLLEQDEYGLLRERKPPSESAWQTPPRSSVDPTGPHTHSDSHTPSDCQTLSDQETVSVGQAPTGRQTPSSGHTLSGLQTAAIQHDPSGRHFPSDHQTPSTREQEPPMPPVLHTSDTPKTTHSPALTGSTLADSAPLPLAKFHAVNSPTYAIPLPPPISAPEIIEIPDDVSSSDDDGTEGSVDSQAQQTFHRTLVEAPTDDCGPTIDGNTSASSGLFVPMQSISSATTDSVPVDVQSALGGDIAQRILSLRVALDSDEQQQRQGDTSNDLDRFVTSTEGLPADEETRESVLAQRTPTEARAVVRVPDRCSQAVPGRSTASTDSESDFGSSSTSLESRMTSPDVRRSDWRFAAALCSNGFGVRGSPSPLSASSGQPSLISGMSSPYSSQSPKSSLDDGILSPVTPSPNWNFDIMSPPRDCCGEKDFAEDNVDGFATADDLHSLVSMSPCFQVPDGEDPSLLHFNGEAESSFVLGEVLMDDLLTCHDPPPIMIERTSPSLYGNLVVPLEAGGMSKGIRSDIADVCQPDWANLSKGEDPPGSLLRLATPKNVDGSTVNVDCILDADAVAVQWSGSTPAVVGLSTEGAWERERALAAAKRALVTQYPDQCARFRKTGTGDVFPGLTWNEYLSNVDRGLSASEINEGHHPSSQMDLLCEPEPDILRSARFSLFRNAVTRAWARNVGSSYSNGVNDLHRHFKRNRVDVRGTFTGTEVSRWGSTWIHNMGGRRHVMYVSPMDMEHRWEALECGGNQWTPDCEYRRILLRPGDTLLLPPNSVYAQYAEDFSISTEGIFWDQRNLADALRAIDSSIKSPIPTDPDICGKRALLDVLEGLSAQIDVYDGLDETSSVQSLIGTLRDQIYLQVRDQTPLPSYDESPVVVAMGNRDARKRRRTGRD